LIRLRLFHDADIALASKMIGHTATNTIMPKATNSDT
jgi:hypothetical protein